LGLSLAIGIVVDDAIMVLENIVRHKEMGKSRMEASLIGSREITLAALAATAAIIAIFLPVAFMQGIIGKYFLQFGVTLSVAVALSLLEALTLTPMRTSRFLSVHKRTSRLGRAVEFGFEKSASLYKRMIPVTLNHPYLTIMAALIFFVGTLFVGKSLKQEFVPAEDQGRLMVRLQAPVGASLPYTELKLREVEAYFSKRPEVESTFASVGGFGGGQVNSAMIFLTLKEERDQSVQELMPIYKKEIKLGDTRVTIQDPSQSGFSARRGYPIEFSIRGPDWRELIKLTEKMTEAMEKSGLVTDVDTNYRAGMPELQVIPDRVRARQRGVDVSEISTAVSTMMAGSVAGKFSEGGKRYDIRV
ncbi:MAG: efflux RND transporter permease subunit, partial [Bdellovibrionota bacterium]